jgi:hypothetical protein
MASVALSPTRITTFKVFRPVRRAALYCGVCNDDIHGKNISSWKSCPRCGSPVHVLEPGRPHRKTVQS